MGNFDQLPSNMNDGGLVLNMFAQAKTGQLSLMGAMKLEQLPVETATSAAPANEELPTNPSI